MHAVRPTLRPPHSFIALQDRYFREPEASSIYFGTSYYQYFVVMTVSLSECHDLISSYCIAVITNSFEVPLTYHSRVVVVVLLRINQNKICIRAPQPELIRSEGDTSKEIYMKCYACASDNRIPESSPSLQHSIIMSWSSIRN